MSGLGVNSLINVDDTGLGVNSLINVDFKDERGNPLFLFNIAKELLMLLFTEWGNL